MAVLPDQSIVATGWSAYAGTYALTVVRYNSAGAFDASFDGEGIVRTLTPSFRGFAAGRAIARQADGRLLIAGEADNGLSLDAVLVRYEEDGSLDSTFGQNGVLQVDFGLLQNESACDVVLQPDGKILLAVMGAASFKLYRYDTTGSADPSFGDNGAVTVQVGQPYYYRFADTGSDIALQADGKIVLVVGVEAPSPSLVVIRLGGDGQPDPTLGAGDGMVSLPHASPAVRTFPSGLEDGRILFAASDGTYMRLHPDGSLDDTFDGDGILEEDSLRWIHDFVAQADGKLLAAGPPMGSTWYDSGVAVVRRNADGSRDASFGQDGSSEALPYGVNTYDVASLALQGDGGVLLADTATQHGARSILLARFHGDGARDVEFGNSGVIVESECRRIPPDSADCVEARSSTFELCGYSNTGGSRLKWKWKGPMDEGVPLATGDPTSLTQYSICIHDTHAGEQQLASWIYPSPYYWSQSGDSGWTHKDRAGMLYGVSGVRLAVRPPPGSSRAIVSSARIPTRWWWVNKFPTAFPLPYSESRYFDAAPSIIVQIVNSEGLCMKSTYSGAQIRQLDGNCASARKP